MSECLIKNINYDDVDHTLGETTTLACGAAACAYSLELAGLGDERKPMATEQKGQCAEQQAEQ